MGVVTRFKNLYIICVICVSRSQNLCTQPSPTIRGSSLGGLEKCSAPPSKIGGNDAYEKFVYNLCNLCTQVPEFVYATFSHYSWVKFGGATRNKLLLITCERMINLVQKMTYNLCIICVICVEGFRTLILSPHAVWPIWVFLKTEVKKLVTRSSHLHH